MDVFEAIGNRRSIRYYQTWRPVEPEKIQMMLEAARRATHAANVNATGAIVVTREEADDSLLGATMPLNVHVRLAPVLIFWYGDLAAWDLQDQTLKQLIDVGALNPSHGWSQKVVDEAVVPLTKAMGEEALWLMTALDAGAAIAQAQLVATALGLGTCLNQWNGSPKLLGLPETCRVFWVMTVGYPAESPEAGGTETEASLRRAFPQREIRAAVSRRSRSCRRTEATKALAGTSSPSMEGQRGSSTGAHVRVA